MDLRDENITLSDSSWHEVKAVFPNMTMITRADDPSPNPGPID